MLSDVYKQVKEDIDARGENLTAPFPNDYPCYYCVLTRACDYCIHNPEAEIYKGFKEG